MLPKPLWGFPSAGKPDTIVSVQKLSRGKGNRLICVGCRLVGVAQPINLPIQLPLGVSPVLVEQHQPGAGFCLP